MIKQNYRRYLLSYKTIVILAASFILTLISYYFSYQEKMGYVSQMSGQAVDFNRDVMQRLIDRYNGFGFFFDSYFMSDTSFIYFLVLYAWVGIFVSSELQGNMESGYGNFIVTRCRYSRYVKDTIISQSLYIATVIAATVVIQVAAAFTVAGTSALNYQNYSSVESAMLIVAQYGILTLYCILVNIISSSLGFWFRNKYVVQMIPLVLFAVIPLIIGSTLANVFSWGYGLFVVISPFEYMTVIYNLMSEYAGEYAFYFGAGVTVFIIMAIVTVSVSVKKLRNNYI
ncbi:MAG: hypothetical protein ACI4EU_10925 [Butyrivibrio sp.]